MVLICTLQVKWAIPMISLFYNLQVTCPLLWFTSFFLGIISIFFSKTQPDNIPFLLHNMNGYRDENSCCYFHPKQILIGVCPLCLNERLLELAIKQGHAQYPQFQHSSLSCRGTSSRTQTVIHKKSPIDFHKIFAFGSLFNRVDAHHWRSENSEHYASTSQEDSFISIKFGDNGVSSWEKNNTLTKVSLESCSNMSWHHKLTMQNNEENKEAKSVIEHGKSHAPLRWIKRIGHLFQLIRWKRSSKNNACHVGKVRKGWIRPLTKRKSME